MSMWVATSNLLSGFVVYCHVDVILFTSSGVEYMIVDFSPANGTRC